MRGLDADTVIATAMMTASALVIVVAAVFFGRSVYVQSNCLELGYAESDVSWQLKGYCIQRDYRGTMHSVPMARAEQVAEYAKGALTFPTEGERRPPAGVLRWSGEQTKE